jgi:hypothetical protein
MFLSEPFFFIAKAMLLLFENISSSKCVQIIIRNNAADLSFTGNFSIFNALFTYLLNGTKFNQKCEFYDKSWLGCLVACMGHSFTQRGGS